MQRQISELYYAENHKNSGIVFAQSENRDSLYVSSLQIFLTHTSNGDCDKNSIQIYTERNN